MTPAVRNTRDALIAIAFFFAAQALVSDASAAIKEPLMGTIPIATDLPRSEEATRDLLQLAGVEVDVEEIAQWSDWKINKAEEWAGAVLLRMTAGVAAMPKPAFLNRYTTSDGEVRP